MERKTLNPQQVCPPVGLYSQASRVKAGEILFIAGQLGLDAKGTLLGKGDAAAQIRQAFRNIGEILASQGASFSNVVEFTTYLTSAEGIAVFMATRTELFATLYPKGDYPPNTLLVISRLVHPDALVEISAVAAL